MEKVVTYAKEVDAEGRTWFKVGYVSYATVALIGQAYPDADIKEEEAS